MTRAKLCGYSAGIQGWRSKRPLWPEHRLLFDVCVLLFGGIGGYALAKVGLPVAPLILGFALGLLLESYLRQALILSYGNPLEFISRPISATFIGLTLLVLVSPYILKVRPSGQKSRNVKS